MMKNQLIPILAFLGFINYSAYATILPMSEEQIDALCASFPESTALGSYYCPQNNTQTTYRSPSGINYNPNSNDTATNSPTNYIMPFPTYTYAIPYLVGMMPSFPNYLGYQTYSPYFQKDLQTYPPVFGMQSHRPANIMNTPRHLEEDKVTSPGTTDKTNTSDEESNVILK